jgi:uncharacterized cupredoxin-like copper-binding protein
MNLSATNPSRRVRGVAIAFAAIAFAAIAGCSGGGPQASADGVAVTLHEFTVDVSDTTLAPASTKLNIQNSGSVVHELEVFTVPSGVDPAAIPVVNGVADTGGAGMTVVDEVENIAPSTRATLTVNLQPGTYVFMCNLPTHYGLGMHTTVTVQ